MRIAIFLLIAATFSGMVPLHGADGSPVFPEDRDWHAWIHEAGANVEMKNRAWEAIIALDARMEAVRAGLNDHLDAEARELLRQSQESWQAYAYNQSALEADSMRAGTGQGLLHSLALIREQCRRIKELQSMEAIHPPRQSRPTVDPE